MRIDRIYKGMGRERKVGEGRGRVRSRRITQAEVDSAIEKFLERGGKIKVLSSEIHYDWEESANTMSYKLLPKVLSN